jgi:serine/threonine protein phosphatase 1
MPVPLFKYFPENHAGRDFVIGDLHGMFETLEQLMAQVAFNTEQDRLFSVGDLVDRGPQSERVLEFLGQPWFHALQGNHEKLLLQSQDSEAVFKAWTERAGGAWWLMVEDDKREAIISALSALPMAFEITTAAGQIGIVHADIPIGLDWKAFVKGLQDDEELQQHAQWSRLRHHYISAKETVPKVPGIDLLVVGHSIVDKPLLAANLYYIDTGAAYIAHGIDSRLTMLQIHPKREVHDIKTGSE